MSVNSQYKKLAYERAVLQAFVRVAREKFLPAEGEEEAEERVEAGELPRDISIVPEDEIIEMVVRIQRLADMRELEMTRYKHTLTEIDDEQEWNEAKKTPTSPGSKGARPQGGKGKGQGGGARPPAPAAGQR